jgi:hypothetical protein
MNSAIAIFSFPLSVLTLCGTPYSITPLLKVFKAVSEVLSGAITV